jgi:hypothetical protein
VVVAAGHYRQTYRDSGTRSGFRVALFALARRQRRGRSATSKRPVGRSSRTERKQRRRWWLHPLFGDIWGLPPPEIPGRDLRRMRSLDEVFQSPRQCCPRSDSLVPQSGSGSQISSRLAGAGSAGSNSTEI